MSDIHEQLIVLERNINKMVELTEEYSFKDPDACMNKARQIAEGICLYTIIKNEVTKPNNLPKTLEQMIQCLKPYREIMDAATLANVSVLQTWGNMGSHYNNTALTNKNISPALEALHNLVDWFFKENELSDFKSGKQTPLPINDNPNSVQDIHKFVIENNVLLKYTGNDTIVTVPQGTTSIADCVFMQNHTLEVINLPEGLAVIGDAAFCDCGNLRRIDFPDSLVRIGNDAFFACSKIEKLSLPKNLLQIGSNAFGNCEKIPEVHIPARLLGLHSDSFHGCISLKRITVDPYSEMFCIFDDCLYDILQEKLLIAPGTKKTFSFPKTIRSIGQAFSGNKAITRIEIPGSIETIEDEAFSNCTFLKKIMLNEGITSIGKLAFYKCSSLEEVVLPKTLPSTGIHSLAFKECTNCKFQIKLYNQKHSEDPESLVHFVSFINGITIKRWLQAQDALAQNPEISRYFVGGLFNIYSRVNTAHEIDNVLLYYKVLYVIALQENYDWLCSYLTNVTIDMILKSADNIKEYMLNNINCFGKESQGLVKICFDYLTASQMNSAIDSEFWETALKETYELYRMIATNE